MGNKERTAAWFEPPEFFVYACQKQLPEHPEAPANSSETSWKDQMDGDALPVSEFIRNEWQLFGIWGIERENSDSGKRSAWILPGRVWNEPFWRS